MDELTSYVNTFLQNAKDDMRSAEQASSSERFDIRNRAYNSQQATEKAMKAALALSGVDFGRTHDLNRLYAELPTGWCAKISSSDLGRLTDMVITARYGNGGTTPTKSDADWAFDLASDIVQAICAEATRRGI